MYASHNWLLDRLGRRLILALVSGVGELEELGSLGAWALWSYFYSCTLIYM